ncbi:MAG: TIGR02281 family clan AA aspartic protease [Burkholderiales bacterium]
MSKIKGSYLFIFIELFIGPGMAFATDVNVVGLFAGKALVEIDRGTPRMMTEGQKIDDVRLVSADSKGAVIEIGGKRHDIPLGQSASNGSGKQSVGGTGALVLTADGRGHYYTTGSINGATTRFVVDTGATSVALSSDEAKRMGLDYTKGRRGMTSTANGVAPMYAMKADKVSVGDITLHNVEVSVIEGAGLPITLLGMSFLNRLEIKQDGGKMTLTKRY